MILIQNASYCVVNADTVLTDVDLYIKDNRIAKIGKNLPTDGVEKIIPAHNKIVSPGFINSHTHLYQNFLKGQGDHLPLKEWCEEATFPFSQVISKYRKMDNYDLGYAYGLLGAVEQIQNGITTFIDFDSIMDTVFQSWEDVGVRGIGGMQTVDAWVPKEFIHPAEETKEKLEKTIQKWNNVGLQKVFISPSTPFACTPALLECIHDLTRKYQVGVQIHVSETRWEVEQALKDFGTTPLMYLEQLGFLKDQPRMQAVHCIHLTRDEWDLMKERQITAVYNPKSNGKLGSGIAPMAELMEQGILCTIATDGAASNDLLDVFEDMRFGSFLQKLKYEDPARFGQKEVFRMATENGAKALGLDAGVLEEGKLADLIIVNIAEPSMAPIHDPISNLIYCARGQDVQTVLINGRIVMEDRVIQTIRAEEAVHKAVQLGELRFREVQGTMRAQS